MFYRNLFVVIYLAFFIIFNLYSFQVYKKQLIHRFSALKSIMCFYTKFSQFMWTSFICTAKHICKVRIKNPSAALGVKYYTVTLILYLQYHACTHMFHKCQSLQSQIVPRSMHLLQKSLKDSLVFVCCANYFWFTWLCTPFHGKFNFRKTPPNFSKCY